MLKLSRTALQVHWACPPASTMLRRASKGYDDALRVGGFPVALQNGALRLLVHTATHSSGRDGRIRGSFPCPFWRIGYRRTVALKRLKLQNATEMDSNRYTGVFVGSAGDFCAR